MGKNEGERGRIPVVWGLPSHLISSVGEVPLNVELDIISTGWATLRRLRGQPCDLLLVHWDLPDSTGPSLAGRVRLLHSVLPIVLTTETNLSHEMVADLISLRVMGPLRMPVNWSALLERFEVAGADRRAGGLVGSGLPATMRESQILHGS